MLFEQLLRFASSGNDRLIKIWDLASGVLRPRKANVFNLTPKSPPFHLVRRQYQQQLFKNHGYLRLKLSLTGHVSTVRAVAISDRRMGEGQGWYGSNLRSVC